MTKLIDGARGFYRVMCRCANCGHTGSLQLPKGTSAPSRELGGRPTECPNCGCREYTRTL